MKSKQFLGYALGACVLLTGCNTVEPLWRTNAPLIPAAAQTNADIFGELIVLNKAEISASALAKQKATCPKVRKYANYLHQQHTANLKQTLSLSQKTDIKPVMGVTAVNLQNHGNDELAYLKTLNGEDFNHAFINAEIADHQTALQLLDRDIAQSTNPKLTQLLKDTRAHVAMHLQKAKAIEKDMH